MRGISKYSIKHTFRAETWIGFCFDIMGQAGLLTDLTVDALPAVTTDALVYADFVDAGASIAAWVTLAVVDV